MWGTVNVKSVMSEIQFVSFRVGFTKINGMARTCIFLQPVMYVKYTIFKEKKKVFIVDEIGNVSVSFFHLCTIAEIS